MTNDNSAAREPEPVERFKGVVEDYKGVEVVVETQAARSHMGYPICDGPAVMRLMLTRPYNSQGQIVEIPVSEIDSVKEVESRPLGETPPIAD